MSSEIFLPADIVPNIEKAAAKVIIATYLSHYWAMCNPHIIKDASVEFICARGVEIVSARLGCRRQRSRGSIA
jgi:hypothetical protein